MVATDGDTPLNSANVSHKLSDDSHTGIFQNNGNLIVSGGYLSVTSVGGVPSVLETFIVLGTSFLLLPFYVKYLPYPASVGTYYYPVAFYTNIPFGCVTDVVPTAVYVNLDATPNNCTITASLAPSGSQAEKRCCFLIAQVTNRSIGTASYNPYGYGYLGVGA